MASVSLALERRGKIENLPPSTGRHQRGAGVVVFEAPIHCARVPATIPLARSRASACLGQVL